MEESVGAHFALQVALKTMTERCQNLQKRVTELEDENVRLKLKTCRTQDNQEGSMSELDQLRIKIAQLTEEKSQLRSNVKLVASENRQLWNRLSKITQDNRSLGSKLSKINDSITQHTKGHSPLIRSKTFTQDAPHTKHLQKALVENDKISLELEDISLKLLSSITKEKNELELQCNEMEQLQTGEILTDSLGFPCLDDDSEDSMADDLEQHISDLKYIKNRLELENEKLQKNLANFELMKAEACKKCSESKTEVAPKEEAPSGEDLDIKMQLESLAQWGSPDPSNTFLPDNRQNAVNKQTCPFCLEHFPTLAFELYLQHVESHFAYDRVD